MEEREIERQFMQTLRRLGRLHLSHTDSAVNRGEFVALASLERWDKRHGGEGARASILAELVEASPQALSRTLRSLESKGFIERTADAKDRRNVLICLTDRGRAVLANGKEKIREQFGQVATRMGEKDLRQLIYLMNRLVDVMQTVIDEQNAENGEAGRGRGNISVSDMSAQIMKEKENEDA